MQSCGHTSEIIWWGKPYWHCLLRNAHESFANWHTASRTSLSIWFSCDTSHSMLSSVIQSNPLRSNGCNGYQRPLSTLPFPRVIYNWPINSNFIGYRLVLHAGTGQQRDRQVRAFNSCADLPWYGGGPDAPLAFWRTKAGSSPQWCQSIKVD